MSVTTQDCKAMVITSVVNTGRLEGTYNLTIADFETYFVGENRILVHNCGNRGTSRSKRRAARGAQRDANNVPTSQPGRNQQGGPGQPRNQIKKDSDGKEVGVVDGSRDANHGPHVEVGQTKQPENINRYGQPRIKNDKSKRDF